VPTLKEIATYINAEVVGEPDTAIAGLCGLSDDLPDHLSFITKPGQRAAALRTRIAAFIVPSGMLVDNRHCLVHPDPELAIALAATLFETARLSYDESAPIHSSACVHPTALLGDGVSVGAYAVIGRDVHIGANTILYPGVVVMDRVVIGRACVLYPHAVVREDCVLGNRVILQPGVSIGGDGYGFVQRDGRHLKIPQLGNVILEDDVEVGANATIDRGRFTATRIGRGTKVDNLVMLAHNVKLGEDCLVVAQTGISGSTTVGDRVTFAGQVGVIGHLNICSDVTVLGKSAVAKDVLYPGTYAGIPARPAERWRKAMAKLYANVRESDKK
jgi:UDP-3-O-[3-hydroxymyristoyl] glucosamine N-acyltransferase